MGNKSEESKSCFSRVTHVGYSMRAGLVDSLVRNFGRHSGVLGVVRRMVLTSVSSETQQGSALCGEDEETAPWISEGCWNAQRVVSAPDDPEQTVPHHHHEGGNPVTQPQWQHTQHTWQYHHMHCLETVTRPCGCIIAWTKFATSESPTNIIHMLEQIYPTPESRPLCN